MSKPLTRSTASFYPQEEKAKQFRFAFVLKPGFDFSALKPHCEKIVYATDGYVSDVNDVITQLREALKGFDVTKDALIPVGSTVACYLAGVVLQDKLLREAADLTSPSFVMGIFTEGEYRFFRVYADGSQESYEVLT